MMVQFSNAEVPIWKLRIGTVVGVQQDGYIEYGHITRFGGIDDAVYVKTYCIEWNYSVGRLIWLED